jgi:hypothetical protein
LTGDAETKVRVTLEDHPLDHHRQEIRAEIRAEMVRLVQEQDAPADTFVSTL